MFLLLDRRAPCEFSPPQTDTHTWYEGTRRYISVGTSPLATSNESLIEEVRDHMLKPPSTAPFHLLSKPYRLFYSQYLQDELIAMLFKDKVRIIVVSWKSSSHN